MVQGVTPALYVTHTVQPKENWYSVGRLYNISPKEIAPFNGVTMEKPLAIGEQLKVPLTTANFSQNGSSSPDEAFVPVYHIVQEKEWMYRISTNYNKVPVESLEKWNNINRDQAKVGTKLIVGYLKVKKDQSALATNSPALPVQSAPPPAPPVLVPPATQPVVRVEEKKPEPVTEIPEKKEEKKSIPPPPPLVEEKKITEKVEEKKITEKKEEVYKPVVSTVSNNNASGGFFSQMFEESGKSSSGSAGIFKSTSGWQDAKYYALMNNVAVGAIVKVTNPENNKTVFAKVLGQLPEMKESAGLTIRISDAAAAELGVTTTRFPLEIKY
jgi:LysM repeat protein